MVLSSGMQRWCGEQAVHNVMCIHAPSLHRGVELRETLPQPKEYKGYSFNGTSISLRDYERKAGMMQTPEFGKCV
eukprot:5157224-Amphidinium_carterae.1